MHFPNQATALMFFKWMGQSAIIHHTKIQSINDSLQSHLIGLNWQGGFMPYKFLLSGLWFWLVLCIVADSYLYLSYRHVQHQINTTTLQVQQMVSLVNKYKSELKHSGSGVVKNQCGTANCTDELLMSFIVRSLENTVTVKADRPA